MNKVIISIISAILFLSACKKEQLSDIQPTIELKVASGFISEDTELGAGVQYKVGVIASAENGENLTNIIIKSNGNTIFDNGYNAPSLAEEITLTKSNEASEKLTFIIRNKARMADSISITIKKAEVGFGSIIKYSSVILGCNENSNIGNYYSLANNLVYTQSEAFNNQDVIDIIYFFDPAGDENALGSPGANLTGILTGSDAPDNWTILPTTRYSRSPISIKADEFDNALNDSLIIANLFTDGGRKAKTLSTGQFWGFVNNENKYGIIKIEDVTGQSTGTLQFSLIMQAE